MFFNAFKPPSVLAWVSDVNKKFISWVIFCLIISFVIDWTYDHFFFFYGLLAVKAFQTLAFFQVMM